MTAPRIALIHAMPIAVEPTGEAFRELWPQARVTKQVLNRQGRQENRKAEPQRTRRTQRKMSQILIPHPSSLIPQVAPQINADERG